MRPVAPHDPAPSRLKYRVERMMLTPLVRFALRVVLPFALIFGLVSLWFAQDDNKQAFNDMIAEARSSFESRPEFQVKLMAIEGASPAISEAIRAELNVSLPSSSFDLDLEAMQKKIAVLDAVERADMRIKQGGTLLVEVTERVPAVLWRHDDKLAVLDRTGVFIGFVPARGYYPELPVIAGENAMEAVPEALTLSQALAPLKARMRGLERMGARRWDVVLDRDQRILLPEQDAEQALARVIAMDQAMDMLERDVVAVDMRLPQRATVRMTEHATQEMWRIKTIEAGGVVE